MLAKEATESTDQSGFLRPIFYMRGRPPHISYTVFLLKKIYIYIFMIEKFEYTHKQLE